jgi:putative transmembrane protein PGPGW
LSHSAEVALGVASVVMFVGTIVAVPIFLVRIPEDYFARPRAPSALPIRVLRTVVGVALIVLGLAMLVLPGQGILTILVGLGVLDLPIKERIMNRLLCHPKVRHAVDAIRHKAGKPSLRVPGACEGAATA